MNKALIILLPTVLIITGCDNIRTKSPVSSSPNVCNINAPNVIGGDQGAVLDTAADLTAFAKLPIKANFKIAVTNKINSTFQKVSDANARCQMLTQLAACYKDQAPEAQKIALEQIVTTGACNG